MDISWEEVENLINSSERILLFGPPGCGKTFIAMQKLKNPISITLTDESSVAELFGHWVPKKTEFIWHDGAATKAWIEGRGLVLNEIDQASGCVLTALHAILDDRNIAAVHLPNNKLIQPIEGFACVATMNGELDQLPEALKDRFEIKIYIDRPHPNAIKQLPIWMQNHFSGQPKNWNFTLREFISFHKLVTIGVDPKCAAKASVQSRWQDLINLMKLEGNNDKEG